MLEQHSIMTIHPMITKDKLRQNPSLALQIVHSPLPIELKTLQTALKNPQRVTTMEKELKALQKKYSWELVPRPQNENVVGSK